MKKILAFIYIMMAVMAAQSQVVTLKFVGADRTGQDYVRLHHVSVYDHDQLWHQVIYYPDTTLALHQNGTVGIVETMCTSSLQLAQNTPNPFTGTTDVNLTTADAGEVTLEIVDGNGKTVGTHRVRPEIGTHQFRVSLNAAGTYVMTARQNGKTSSIKMVCNGGGGGNSITHVGSIGSDGTITLFLKNGMSDGSYPFRWGDRMEYTGYAVIDDTERVSETVNCNQGNYSNSNYSLKFDVARPEVTTLESTGVTATNAIWHGEVTADNNALVTERGFCWKIGAGTPTIFDNYVAVGDGVGAFVVGANDYSPLQPATNYRVRAYAVNAIGITYGETKAFTTLADIPTVVTTEPTNAGCETFTAGGQITYNGGANITSKGICWNTTGLPTIADAHTSDGTGNGSFTSTATGLQIGTTYYVRAYATNSVGTGYGEEFTVNTDSAAPAVATLTVELANLAAMIGGEVMDEHCLEVTARGICWNTTGTPTLADSHTTDGTGLGIYTGTLDNLTEGTTYYARAYATNAAGTTYGNEVSFTAVALPTVTTAAVTDMTATTAVGGGNVIADGSSAVIARGVCWSTNHNPTITSSHITNGSGLGNFTSNLTGLSGGTMYYIRAFATNSDGTAYGEEVSFTTLDTLPVVATSSVTNIASTTATCGGNVTDDGGALVTARGVCWSTSHNPTISDNHTTDGDGTGSFTSSLTNLTPTTIYYVRAYATNSVGTVYGSEVSFTTTLNDEGLPCPSAPTLTDIDGNVYNTVQIGNQCWMKENLRTTHYVDNTPIPAGGTYSDTEPYRFAPDNNEANVATYGYLYNWSAVMHGESSSNVNPSTVQGICPTGWHVPSYAEWTQLTNYVKSQSQYVCGSDNDYIAKSLASTTGWMSSSNTCAVGNTPSNNNATGFSALPAGAYSSISGNFGYYAYYWSTSEYNSGSDSNSAWKCNLTYGNAEVRRQVSDKVDGNSVRCVKD